MNFALVAGAGWGVAFGLTIALIIALWVLFTVLELLRKTTDRPPAEGADVLSLTPGQRTHQRG
jgi:hypothetical protein